jgi:ribosomal protein S12 methylthiotransferase
VRLLYLYPSDLTDELIDAICDTGVPYFDLSLQHVSKPLLRRMRRWGDGDRFLRRIADIRDREPDAAFRSNFIVGYPGETEADHDQLLRFVEEAQLDWCGFFAYSPEDGTYAYTSTARSTGG